MESISQKRKRIEDELNNMIIDNEKKQKILEIINQDIKEQEEITKKAKEKEILEIEDGLDKLKIEKNNNVITFNICKQTRETMKNNKYKLEEKKNNYLKMIDKKINDNDEGIKYYNNQIKYHWDSYKKIDEKIKEYSDRLKNLKDNNLNGV
jgi:hypothetical protein